MSKFIAGSTVEYWSTSYSQWVETLVEQVQPTGEVQVACKPGYWMGISEQRQKLRAKPGGIASPVKQEEKRQSEARPAPVGAIGATPTSAAGPRREQRSDSAGYPLKDAGRPTAGLPVASPSKDRPSADVEGLPSQAELEDLSRDLREPFQALRNWLQLHERNKTLSAAGRSLDSSYRRSVFSLLCAVPSRKPIFQNQARYCLECLAGLEEWRSGDVLSDADLQAALRPAPRKTGSADGGAASATGSVPDPAVSDEPPPPPPDDTEYDSSAPELLPPAPDEPTPFELLSGMPPPEAFEERSRHDSGDTFKDFRKWALKQPVWDLAAAGLLLDAPVRRNIFQFLVKICKRRLYRLQGPEVLSMLLPLEEWTVGDVVDPEAVNNALDMDDDKSAPMFAKGGGRGRPASPSPSPVPPPAPAPAPAARPSAAEKDELPPPPPPPTGTAPHPPASDLPPNSQASQDKGLRARVEAALSGGKAIADGSELVGLYRNSGLGGEASMSGKACDGEALKVILAAAGQRLRDLFVDTLQQASGDARVHFPHLYIDLMRKSAIAMPKDVQSSVERKIRNAERWSSMEKAYVLLAQHKLTIPFVLAYSLSQAKAAGRLGAVWINMGMNSGAQGHANAVCLYPTNSRGAMKVLIYDPNYEASQKHWVHAQKAVNDSLPSVERLLKGTGITIVGSAELFGHGLQTALGTTTKHQGWFSKAVVVTSRGYPICGSVVHLLALVWVMIMKDSRGAVMEDIVAVEQALSEIVADAEGKVRIQRKIAAVLAGMTQSLSGSGSDSFASSMNRRLDRDKQDWPREVVKNGGSLNLSMARHFSCEYKW